MRAARKIWQPFFTLHLIPDTYPLLSHSTFRDTYITIAKMVNKPILPTNKA